MPKNVLSKETRKRYLKELNLKNDDFKHLGKLDPEVKQLLYTTYKPSELGKLSNLFFERLTLYLTLNYPDIFVKVANDLTKSGIKILSKTYISIMLFCSFLTSLVIVLGAVALSILRNSPIINVVLNATVFAFLSFFLVALIFYLYPGSVASTKSKMIKKDLPFVIIHMSSIAGSGAHPMSMFKLILKSEEYKGLHSEIKKIVNYVNLFGYDFSTALKAVAKTTASPRFNELLNGIVANTQSGGDIKNYLDEKGIDALNTYRLEHKKYVQTIATFSDIYTALLIAAPLLFIVTLAIINILGGKIGGLSLSTIANVGTFFVIPILNIGFLTFVHLIDPEK